jgi:hypothetical protein
MGHIKSCLPIALEGRGLGNLSYSLPPNFFYLEDKILDLLILDYHFLKMEGQRLYPNALVYRSMAHII